MAGKGAKNCCCDGCNGIPVNRQLPTGAIQPVQQYCCSCMPNYACVTISLDSGESEVKQFGRICSGGKVGYGGTIRIAGNTVDIELYFDVIYEECNFCLTSAALGVTADCQPLTEYDSTFCRTLQKNGGPISWSFAALGGGTVSVTPANNTAITNRARGCRDAEGNFITDEHPIRNLCGCCSCICECACIRIYGDDRESTAVIVCLNGTTSYVTADGLEVEIVPNYATNGCELHLVSVGYSITLSDVAVPFEPVPIGTVENPCPSPTALWSSFTSDDKAIFFEFSCAPCGVCATINNTCCDGSIPASLTATIDSSCPTTCGDLAISLVYDSDFEVWTGTTTLFCEHEATLTLSCGGGVWSLTFSGDPCAFSGSGHIATWYGDCPPLSMVFNFTGMGGIGCCGPGDTGGPYTMTISVTE